MFFWRFAMNLFLKITTAVAGTLALALAAAAVAGQFSGGNTAMGGAGHGMGGGGHSMGGGGHGMGAGGHGPMGGPVSMLTTKDEGSEADMNVVHDLLASNTQIKRSVTNLPDGIRTLTESDDPKVAQSIQAHVVSMSQRLKDGREFNIFSDTLPVLFGNRDKIVSKVEMTAKGAAVTRTSTDAKVVAALQGHAGEVTELVDEGMVAMRRGMMSRMAMGQGGMEGRGMGVQGMGRQGMGPGRHDHDAGSGPSRHTH